MNKIANIAQFIADNLQEVGFIVFAIAALKLFTVFLWF